MYLNLCILEKMFEGYDDILLDGWWRRRGWLWEGVHGIKRINTQREHTLYYDTHSVIFYIHLNLLWKKICY